MPTILENPRTRKGSAKATAIREVCLVGTPARSYRHLTPGGLRAEGSGLGRERKGRLDAARVGAT